MKTTHGAGDTSCVSCIQGRARANAGSPTATRRRLDPRISLAILLVLNIQAFFVTNVVYEVLMVGCGLALLVWMRKPRLAFGCLCGYAILWAISAACVLGGPFFTPISTCFAMFHKVMPTAIFAAGFIASTRIGEMSYALQTVGLSGRFTVALSVALRFFPTAAREAQAVREAMRTRGIRITPKTLVTRPAALLENFMVPFIHRLSVVADDLGNAVMVRGIETAGKRTSYYELRIGVADVVVVAVVAGITLAMIGGVL